METLDLKIHDPEEFEGKCISLNGCDYIIGPYIGSGSSKIVHQLINKISRLSLHVLLIYLIPEFAPSALEREYRTLAGIAGLKNVPHSVIKLQRYGGTMLIESSLQQTEEEATNQLTDEATKAFFSSDFSRAASLFRQILDINPYHTIALHNLAIIHADSGNLGSAFGLQEKVINIEPNYLPYFNTYFLYAEQCNMFRAIIKELERMEMVFPYIHDFDSLRLNVYLKVGQPEKAEDFLGKSNLDEIRKKEVMQIIQTELSAKRRSLAIMQEARSLQLSAQYNSALDLLEQAYTIYERNPLLALNLGLAVQRAGDFERAKQLLLSRTLIIRHELIKVCFANVAFGEIKAANFEEAVKSLKITMELLMNENDGKEPNDLFDLPGIATWFYEEWHSEESPNNVVPLIKYIEEFAKQNQVPELVKRLMLLYRKAAINFEKLS